jgi:hypothetical protein
MTKILNINNFFKKWNFKNLKTLKDRVKNSLQNSVFTFFKLNFLKKLIISKLFSGPT